MSKIIYTEPTKEFRTTASQEVRNPRYFKEVRSNATEVVIVGDQPKVEKAYKAAGVKVTKVSSTQELKG